MPQPVAEADYGAAALTELWPEATPQDALARIGEPLVRALLAFERDGFAPLQDAYARRDVLRGQLVRTTDARDARGRGGGRRRRRRAQGGRRRPDAARRSAAK